MRCRDRQIEGNYEKGGLTVELNMKHPAPIGATVSRKTGEIRIKWADDIGIQRRFGRAMEQLGRMQDIWADIEAQKEANRFYAEIDAKMKAASEEAFRSAAT